jgi:hypothetical protein
MELPAPVQSVLDLFASELADVRFADVDAPTLARLAAEVRSVAEVVASAQAALESARRALDERQELLLGHVQRAVAYARVYAENNEELSQRIEAIALPRATRRVRGADDTLVLSPGPQPSPRPRGRPKKSARMATADSEVNEQESGLL